MMLRYRVLLIAGILVLGVVGIIVYQQYVDAKAHSVSPTTVQYHCVAVPNVKAPLSTPPTVGQGTYVSSSSQQKSCPPGYVPQPVGKYAPKGMPRP